MDYFPASPWFTNIPLGKDKERHGSKGVTTLALLWVFSFPQIPSTASEDIFNQRWISY